MSEELIEQVKKILRERYVDGLMAEHISGTYGKKDDLACESYLDKLARQICQLWPKTEDNPGGWQGAILHVQDDEPQGNPDGDEQQTNCEHDYEATFQGGDTYKCSKCGKEIDMTEDDDGY